MKETTTNTSLQHKLKSLTIAMAMGCCTTIASAASVDFKYSGDTGPGFWDELPGAAECGRSNEPGARQTPIDITNAVYDSSLERLDLHTYPTTVSLKNNGHTVEQEYEGTGSSIYLGGVDYELLQFHFHTQSEHAVGGKRGVMEMHAVFRDASQTQLAVVGLIFKIGDHNDFLQSLIDAGLPKKKGDTTHAASVQIDLADALTNTSKYYNYQGSLTTPPCSEIVNWVVLKKKARMSEAQFKVFNDIMGNNFRPLQDRNGREVRISID